MNTISSWQKVFDCLVDQGLPKELLLHGCIAPYDAADICDIIEKRAPTTMLEVGTFVGLSTGVIALTMSQDARLISVDPNLPVTVQSKAFGYFQSTGCQVFAHKILENIHKEDRVILLQGFFSMLPYGALRAKLISQGIAVDANRVIGDKIVEYGPYAVVFLDGDHYADTVYHDLVLIAKHISRNAQIIVHDFEGGWSTEISAGVEKFLKENESFSLITDGNLGLLENRG